MFLLFINIDCRIAEVENHHVEEILTKYERTYLEIKFVYKKQDEFDETKYERFYSHKSIYEDKKGNICEFNLTVSNNKDLYEDYKYMVDNDYCKCCEKEKIKYPEKNVIDIDENILPFFDAKGTEGAAFALLLINGFTIYRLKMNFLSITIFILSFVYSCAFIVYFDENSLKDYFTNKNYDRYQLKSISLEDYHAVGNYYNGDNVYYVTFCKLAFNLVECAFTAQNYYLKENIFVYEGDLWTEHVMPDYTHLNNSLIWLKYISILTFVNVVLCFYY